MEEKVLEIHERIFNFLSEEAERNINFQFSLRKSDKENKLTKGYWFYGNLDYVALSFWAGTDWKKKTPNIKFIIKVKDHSSSLEITTSDSVTKDRFVDNILFDRIIGLTKYGQETYIKDYDGSDYLISLKNFILEDKILIDGAIKNNQSYFENEPLNNRIDFIDHHAFRFSLEKTNEYRNRKLLKIVDNDTAHLKKLEVTKFCGIENLKIDNLPNNSQWIFFTGTNGSGKSSILKALTVALCPKVKEHLDFDEPGQYKIKTELYRGEKKTIKTNAQAGNVPVKQFVTTGFAAYGPSRLLTSDYKTKKAIKLKELQKRQSYSYSIFHTDGILLDFASEITKLIHESKDGKTKEKLNIIIETLIECIDPLANIFVNANEKTNTERTETLFVEQDENGNKYSPVKYFHLSSGTKSLIAMIGDMMTRLFLQQPNVYDIAELKGLVLIDEIDIHFHPKQQKNLIEALSNSFPKVQFIVTTHSPIPFLGAPKGTIIYNVKRTVNEGVYVQRLDDKVMFDRIMPNAILNSPIFGLEDLIPSSKDKDTIPIIEDDFSEIKIYEKLEKDVSSFLTNQKQKELIELFSNKDEKNN